MLYLIAIAVFVLTLAYASIDNRQRKKELQRQLEKVQKKIAEKEQPASDSSANKSGDVKENITSAEDK